MDIESRVGKIEANSERIFGLLSDFTNLGAYIPHDKVGDFVADTDSCSFTVDKIGKFGMRIIEREPFQTIKIVNDENVPFQFKLWIQLKPVSEQDTRVKVTLKADLNPMLTLLAKKPLTTFVETLVDKLEQIK